MVAALPLPMWNATRNLVTRPSLPVVVWAAVGIAYVFSAILPLFYFAMWRNIWSNGGEVRVPKRRRWFCLAGALCGVIVIVTQMPVTSVTTLLSVLATLSCVGLLIAMFRSPGETGGTSRFLRSMTWIAVVGGALWFAINLLTLISNPGAGAVRTLLEQVCLFTAPFLVAVGHRFG